MSDQLKLYIWKDTRILSGSWWGGTMCVIANSPDEARDKLKKAFKNNPKLSRYENMHEIICSDNTTAWDWLIEDLEKEPEIGEYCLAEGGDY